MGGSPCLVVMGDDSCSEGCGFKSLRHILDGHLDILKNKKNQANKNVFKRKRPK